MKKKVVLMCSSMQGHFQLFTRLGEWLLLQPDLAVHFVAHDKLKDKIPEGIHHHTSNGEIADMEALFKGVAKDSTDWYDSIGRMMGGIAMDDVGTIFKEILQILDDIQPDLLVAEIAFNATTHLQAFCRSRSFPLVLLVPPSRPDPLMQISTLIPLLFGHFRAISSAIQVLGKAKEDVSLATGLAPAGDSDQPLTLLPGSRALMKGSLGKHQLFTGPFLRLPELGDGLPSSALPEGDLRTWFEQEPLDPVVYIAFGTLVRPSREIVERIVEALDGESLRVLWSLPRDVHSFLPPGLTSRRRWRIETFVPQDTVLGMQQVKCFISHGGANGVHEALSLGLPMVCMPFFCDQYEWAASVCQECGAGIQVDKIRSSAADIRKAVNEVLTHPTYCAQARAAALRMRAHVKACQAELAVEAREQDRGGVSIAGKAIMRCLRGDNWQDFVPAVKAVTDSYAPSSDACLFACA